MRAIEKFLLWDSFLGEDYRADLGLHMSALVVDFIKEQVPSSPMRAEGFLSNSMALIRIITTHTVNIKHQTKKKFKPISLSFGNEESRIFGTMSLMLNPTPLYSISLSVNGEDTFFTIAPKGKGSKELLEIIEELKNE